MYPRTYLWHCSGEWIELECSLMGFYPSNSFEPLLVMCRSVRLTSHSITASAYIAVMGTRWMKMWLSGSSCLHTVLFDECAAFSQGRCDCSSGVWTTPGRATGQLNMVKTSDLKLCTFTITFDPDLYYFKTFLLCFFQAQVPCFLEHGFCTVMESEQNWNALYAAFDPGDSFGPDEALSPKMVNMHSLYSYNSTLLW